MMKKNKIGLGGIFLLVFACGSRPPAIVPNYEVAPGSTVSARPQPYPEENSEPATEKPTTLPKAPSVSEEIRALTASGSPANLFKALELIRSRELSAGEFGRNMNAICIYIFRNVYPDIKGTFPTLDPPGNSSYSLIFRGINSATYAKPDNASTDPLVYFLPFIALLKDTNGDRMLQALPDLEKALELNTECAIAIYFMGLTYEKNNNLDDANKKYEQALELAPDCYPAVQGKARIMLTKGLNEDAVKALTDLLVQYPESINVKKQLAHAYFDMKNWSRAESTINEVLQQSPRDPEFTLMRAYVLVEEGLYPQAQAPLDIYAAINPNNVEYLFLRARVQFEGYKNRDAAINYLRSILSSPALNDDMGGYAAKLLMESTRAAERSEGRALLEKLLAKKNPSVNLIELAINDAIQQENWTKARSYVDKLLAERRSSEDLLKAYTIEQGLGNNATALSYARELHEKNPQNNEYCIAYISALLNTGRSSEASDLIEKRLATVANGPTKSRYYFLRSRTKTSEEARLIDLRSSLFEDPRNLDALIAMFEIYRRQNDSRRAVYYLKQALAIDPNNPRLLQYEKEYE